MSSLSLSSSSASQGYLEEFDTEFHCDLRIAKNIVKSLKRPKDREIASRLMNRVMALDSNSLEVKSNRNKFTKYLVRVLKKTKDTQPAQYDQWFSQKEKKTPEETSMWSPDRRTFVATKTIPGFGMLVYLAVAYEPELGWQENGFLMYKF